MHDVVQGNIRAWYLLDSQTGLPTGYDEADEMDPVATYFSGDGAYKTAIEALAACKQFLTAIESRQKTGKLYDEIPAVSEAAGTPVTEIIRIMRESIKLLSRARNEKYTPSLAQVLWFAEDGEGMDS